MLDSEGVALMAGCLAHECGTPSITLIRELFGITSFVWSWRKSAEAAAAIGGCDAPRAERQRAFDDLILCTYDGDEFSAASVVRECLEQIRSKP